MKPKRIIPCMDIDNRKVVKGRKFLDVQEVADPLERAKKYVADGADELVFYDISASVDGREMFLDLIQEIASVVPIPFIVGGGIKSLKDIENVLAAGGDKVSINSAALTDPDLIPEAVKRFGPERIMLSMDVKRAGDGKWKVYAKAGKEETGIDAIEWAKTGERWGAGELVVNSIDEDGVKAGYDIELYKALDEAVSIPVVASGGAGTKEDFLEVLTNGRVESALAASVFHYDEIGIKELKRFLQDRGVDLKDDCYAE